MDLETIKYLDKVSGMLKNLNNNDNIRNIITELNYKKMCVAKESGNKELLPSDVCKRCGTSWNDGLFSLDTTGQYLQMKKKKLNYGSGNNLSSSINKNRKSNVLVKTCRICNTKNKFCVKKPFKKKIDRGQETPKATTPLSNLTDSSIKKKKKKKSKKDSFAGLSPAVVLQSRLSSDTCQKDRFSLEKNEVLTNNKCVINHGNIGSDVSNDSISSPNIPSVNRNSYSSNQKKKEQKTNSPMPENISAKKKSKKRKNQKKSCVSKFLDSIK